MGELLQPGTTGQWNGIGFTLTGRIILWSEEAVMNMWTMKLDLGGIAYLYEGYGCYLVLEDAELPQAFERGFAGSDYRPGTTKELWPDQTFLLNELTRINSWEAEGETEFPKLSSRINLYDFSSTQGKEFMAIEWSEGAFKAYRVTPKEFGAFQFQQLNNKEKELFTFSCTKCSSVITVKTYPYAGSCACNECGTYFVLNGKNGYASKGLLARDFVPDIPIGSSGEIKGITYEVVGCAQKEEVNKYRSKWREYTLYNPAEGYATLSEFDGHWIYVRQTTESPVLLSDSEKAFHHDGKFFEIFNSYLHKVIYATGEFPSNIFDNQATKASEFIHPPFVWIKERDKKEGIHWYLGEHIAKRTIQKAFNPPVALPQKQGIGAVQPSGGLSTTQLGVAFLTGVLILIVMHNLLTDSFQQRLLHEKEYEFPDSLSQVTAVTDKFYLDKKSSNIELTISAPVDNSWFELSATLVNVETGREYSVEQGVEYYHGISEGESWAEGTQSEKAYFTALPAGNYHLQLQASRDAYRSISRFSVAAVYDVPTKRNFGFGMLLLGIWAFGTGLRNYYINDKRWENSPFSYED